MRNLIYFLAILFVVAWATGFFFFNPGSIIHVLLVFALVALILNITRSDVR
jgi:hypothetical protein